MYSAHHRAFDLACNTNNHEYDIYKVRYATHPRRGNRVGKMQLNPVANMSAKVLIGLPDLALSVAISIQPVRTRPSSPPPVRFMRQCQVSKQLTFLGRKKESKLYHGKRK